MKDADSRETLIDQIVHNWQRADLRPYETADALVRLKSEFNMTLAEIARLTGKSIGEVGKLVALVEKVVPEVQERVREIGNASLTKRHLYTLSQLAPKDQKRSGRPHRARAAHRRGDRAAGPRGPGAGPPRGSRSVGRRANTSASPPSSAWCNSRRPTRISTTRPSWRCSAKPAAKSAGRDFLRNRHGRFSPSPSGNRPAQCRVFPGKLIVQLYVMT